MMSLCFTDGKTRTKDKYRVVYTDHQRLELEKEFHYSKYITIRRKAELATTLGLSERQVRQSITLSPAPKASFCSQSVVKKELFSSSGEDLVPEPSSQGA